MTPAERKHRATVRADMNRTYSGYTNMNASGFLETVHKITGEKRYYVGGCRVKKAVFESVGDGRRECFLTTQTATHWRHRHERRL